MDPARPTRQRGSGPQDGCERLVERLATPDSPGWGVGVAMGGGQGSRVGPARWRLQASRGRYAAAGVAFDRRACGCSDPGKLKRNSNCRGKATFCMKPWHARVISERGPTLLTCEVRSRCARGAFEVR